MAAEEVRDPHRDILRGFLLGIGTLVVLAVVTLFVAAGITDAGRIGGVDAPLPAALAAVFGADHFFARVRSVIGLFGLAASLHGIIIGYSRQAFAMARAGHLPAFLAYVTWRGEEVLVMAWPVAAAVDIAAVSRPTTAAAAAIAGESRWVRAPGPAFLAGG